MCLDAERAAGEWLALGATRLTLHAESVADLSPLIASFRRHYGGGADLALSSLVSFGLALNIASDTAIIEPYLADIEYVQFMGIARIGAQGEAFDRRVLEKIRAFRAQHPAVAVQVDGGVSLQTAKELLPLGVSNLVVGSAILSAADPSGAVAAFETLQNPSAA